MVEAKQFAVSHEELIELLIKQSGVHEGLWSLLLGFNIAASSFGGMPGGPNGAPTPVGPGVLVTIQQKGIQRMDGPPPADSPGAIFVDAALVNPKQPSEG